jgi:Tfp pilus assembly protein PilX
MRKLHRGDDGIALMMALMVIVVATILAVAALNLATHTLNGSSVDRNRTQSVAAAEAALDNAVFTIQQAGANLPCTIAPGTLPTSPATAKYSVTISYYSTNPPTGAPLSCTSTPGIPGSVLPTTSVAASAEITSKAYVGSASATGRAMDAEITLTPQEGLGDAIYGYNLISLSNNATMTRMAGSTAPDADLYTNGDFVCSNNETIDGSVYAQGSISASNGSTCSVTGSYEAVGSVLLDGQMTVGHDVVAAGPGSGSTINLKNVTVGGSVSAAGTVTSQNTTISGSKTENASSLSVPTQPFPQYTYQSSYFNGWAIHENVTDCSTSPTDTNSVYYMVSHMSSATANTVITTSCAITWSSTSFNLAKDLVIFSTGGFTTSQQVQVDSTNSTTHNLELIVPYGTSCSGTNGQINFSNQTALGNGNTPDDIDSFLYTPCNITLANNQGITGQVYSDGTVTITNKWTMTMQEMPLFGALINATPLSYIAEYDYKREIPYT